METVPGQSANTAAGDDNAVDVAHRATGAPPPGTTAAAVATGGAGTTGAPAGDGASTTADAPVFLIYGGPAATIGWPGSFDDLSRWWERHQTVLQSSEENVEGTFKGIFANLQRESAAMAEAIVCPPRKDDSGRTTQAGRFFPLPTKDGVTCAATILEEIYQLDASGVPRASLRERAMMRPNESELSYTLGGEPYYLLGPFTNKQELLAALGGDPMLGLVFKKWSTFDPKVLNAAFTFGGKIYLQIRWPGWFVRPVLELDREQCWKLFSAWASTASTDVTRRPT